MNPLNGDLISILFGIFFDKVLSMITGQQSMIIACVLNTIFKSLDEASTCLILLVIDILETGLWNALVIIYGVINFWPKVLVSIFLRLLVYFSLFYHPLRIWIWTSCKFVFGGLASICHAKSTRYSSNVPNIEVKFQSWHS